MAIKLNDILRLTDSEIQRTKIRFMVESGNFQPLADVKNEEKQDKINLVDLVFNREKSISFKSGVIAIGFLPLENDMWLMTGIVDILKDNGYAKAAIAEYRDKKFNFRLVVKFHKDFQNGIVKAENFINELEVLEIWNPNKSLNDKKFPGYHNVKIDYYDLKNKLKISDEWRTALRCRKGIYLISDKKTGKLYIGSAYGKDGILGRWKTYIESGYDRNEKENGKYPNKKLQELVKEKGMSYIQENFQYSILETFTDEISETEIINRESWWKEVMLSREFGYNAN